ncbi:MAG TPA: serine hydrolase [Ginsengibacter sp.]|nr:serine hydrolase [Ginsengibacter sp.]
MKIKKLPAIIIILVIFCACTSTKKNKTVSQLKIIDTISTKSNDTTVNKVAAGTTDVKTDSFLVDLLNQYPEYFDNILKNKSLWNVQIIYTQINRDKNNVPSFKDYFFNVDSGKYFYPASTVKLPIALLALQKLNELNKTGITRSTSMITDAAYSGQTATYNDPQTADGRPTVESYIKRIFLVSDNEAFNRLYEFLGQKYINEQLHAKGYEDAQILHRLEISLSEDENRHTNPVKFLDSNNNVLYSQPLAYNSDVYPKRNDFLGDAYYSNGKFIDTPMNFSKKNRISLEDLHQILRSVIFPGEVNEKQRFNLTKTDYDFVHQYMSQFPSETIYPSYDSLPDAYVKFLLYGTQKEPLPKNIRIFNKPGDAYGQMIDVAYITDFDKNIEFFLSAAINCNTDGVSNDDKYDYDTIGLPFMKNLGQVIYNYESKRKKLFQPDLSSLKITYDK